MDILFWVIFALFLIWVVWLGFIWLMTLSLSGKASVYWVPVECPRCGEQFFTVNTSVVCPHCGGGGHVVP